MQMLLLVPVQHNFWICKWHILIHDPFLCYHNFMNLAARSHHQDHVSTIVLVLASSSSTTVLALTNQVLAQDLASGIWWPSQQVHIAPMQMVTLRIRKKIDMKNFVCKLNQWQTGTKQHNSFQSKTKLTVTWVSKVIVTTVQHTHPLMLVTMANCALANPFPLAHCKICWVPKMSTSKSSGKFIANVTS